MSFNWKEFSELAQCLASDLSDAFPREACQRTAISRSYYAAFCICRNFARDKEGLRLTRTKEDRKIVKDHYLGSSNRDRQRIGTNLNRLWDYRRKADYDDVMFDPFPPDLVAETSIQMTQEVLDTMDKLATAKTEEPK